MQRRSCTKINHFYQLFLKLQQNAKDMQKSQMQISDTSVLKQSHVMDVTVHV